MSQPATPPAPPGGTGQHLPVRDERLFGLFSPAGSLAGVGPAIANALRRLLRTDEPTCLDLLMLKPSAHRDIEESELDGLSDGMQAAVEIEVIEHIEPPNRKVPYRILVRAGMRELELVFFRYRKPWLEEAFALGCRQKLVGRLQRYGQRWQMAHPEVLPAGGAALAQTAMLYPLSEGLTQARLRKLVAAALERAPAMPEWHDAALLAEMDLPDWRSALIALHSAAEVTPEQRQAGIRRLALDELLATQLGLRLLRRQLPGRRGRPLPGDGRLREALLAALPFAPTGAQLRSFEEIAADMGRETPMMRLLMGDVGSGKTLVALVAMLQAIESGVQAALMAPTEVLARQHGRTLEAMTEGLDVRIAVLTGQDGAKARREARAALEEGEIDIVVGTHALFQDDVAFRDLGLVVIDEQHRFGVHQRLHLVRKGALPHVLLMTATPIPRSLVLTHYGDIDVSRLDERPPGRLPVTTSVLPAARLDRIIEGIARALGRGERVFWICPVIESPEEETDGDGLASAEARFELLKEHFGDAVGLVHGRLKAAEKDRRMQDFATGAIRLLVATTVVEVGVDVPEATVIVIDGAERFGLAQLHQLRGRVGRGSRAAHCLLVYGTPLSHHARARLKIMRESDDGFRIAEEDLKLRGPGEILGVRQSGAPVLVFADLVDHQPLIETARQAAVAALEEDPMLESERGQALRLLLQLFRRHEALGLIAAG